MEKITRKQELENEPHNISDDVIKIVLENPRYGGVGSHGLSFASGYNMFFKEPSDEEKYNESAKIVIKELLDKKYIKNYRLTLGLCKQIIAMFDLCEDEDIKNLGLDKGSFKNGREALEVFLETLLKISHSLWEIKTRIENYNKLLSKRLVFKKEEKLSNLESEILDLVKKNSIELSLLDRKEDNLLCDFLSSRKYNI